MARGVLVFAEVAQGRLKAIALEILGAGRRLADALGEPLMAAVLGQGIAEAAQEAVLHGADTVYAADAAALAHYQTLTYCGVMAQIAQQAAPNILLIGMGAIGRELGPRLAFRLRTGLASDCIDLRIHPDTRLMEATRLIAGGNAMATLMIERTRPHTATVRGKTMAPAVRDASRQGHIMAVEVTLDAAAGAVTLVERVQGCGYRRTPGGCRDCHFRRSWLARPARFLWGAGAMRQRPGSRAGSLTGWQSMRAGCLIRCRWG